MSIATFTVVHVVISLIAIAARAPSPARACSRKAAGSISGTPLFLLFDHTDDRDRLSSSPSPCFTPALGVGIVSSVALAHCAAGAL
jgi:hypothetical protein